MITKYPYQRYFPFSGKEKHTGYFEVRFDVKFQQLTII